MADIGDTTICALIKSITQLIYELKYIEKISHEEHQELETWLKEIGKTCNDFGDLVKELTDVFAALTTIFEEDNEDYPID